MGLEKLAIVDLDGTLVRGQSQLLLLRFLRERKEIGWWYFFRLYTWFMLYKLGIVQDPQKPLRQALRFLVGKNVADVESLVRTFVDSKLSSITFREGIDLLRSYKERGQEILLLSSAAEPLVKEVARFFGIDHYIGTKLRHTNGRYTGDIDGTIVYGDTKADSARAWAKERQLALAESVAYADHGSDLPLLESVGRPVAVNPDRNLAKEARLRGWEVLRFKETG
ncbi:hypothetical protein A3D62_00465 [Candidatus Kaiserbacteria bacterium RIFCSPHIGHO2_02_FULL_49_11]|uniref:HAD-IB family hydrolase n=1 Tax=Candidatus Kaiserbacteria bacterium RIFCSPHIGHO2_02_FULL_49_11 TaxID=1798489 RepID=A0A1F6CYZ3_9BACT|nr:MAG: hypothetical protein A3D62_00465 [Candidatus Kaiserbacteria bacterium RIFCSPHIGHO2_02_FULL_49_11]